MSTVVVTGTQWGDEGKGKIVDYLAQQAETVVRFQGGSNAGHTVVVDGVDYKLRLMPSGILFKGSHCVIGNGVAFNPKVMLQEMDNLAERGIDLSGIRISNRAQLVLPYHCLMDQLADEARGKNKVGTTHNGIGPCYVDRDNRIGIRVCDFIDKEEFAKRLKENLAIKNRELKLLYDHEPLDYEEILEEYNGYADRLRPYVCDTIALLDEEIKAGRKILFEGAQATMLDIDYGTYPYVTASHPISGGVGIGAGVAPQKIDKVVGIVKAYCTRVGEGPFPTELFDETGDYIRNAGGEFGTVTGRPRRTGWFDAVVARYAVRVNGLTDVVINKIDPLRGLPKLKVCVAYKLKNGETVTEFPANFMDLVDCEPVYEEFDGFDEDITNCRSFEELPATVQSYIKELERIIECPITMLGVGPARDQVMTIK